MTKYFILLILMVGLGLGCSKKKKPDEIMPDAGASAGKVEDSNIQNKDLAFDAQSSDSGKIEGLYTLRFEYDKATLTPDSRTLAQKNADWLRKHPEAKLQVEGHCDRHGSQEYNLALGERRARAAKAYIVNLGIQENRLSTISYGKERLLDSSEAESSHPKNRRANFVIQGK